MPRRDGTGPAGMGPATGNRAGAGRGYANGQAAGLGKGLGCRSGRGHAFRSMSHAMKPSRRGQMGLPSSAEEKETVFDEKSRLVRRAECLEEQLKQIKEQLSQ
ncbi:MAG: DUF5320 domain-containing protein [Oscillospiraceae bacterium]